MRNKGFLLLLPFLLLSLFMNSACQREKEQSVADEHPILMFRLSMQNSVTDEACANLLSVLKEYPNCCDEVWFSTGTGMPYMDVHSQHAQILTRAMDELEKINIKSSLQIQMTIGHGDQLGGAKEWIAKNWTGWTGSTGVEGKYSNCPRQPGFLEYMREMTRLYAQTEPRVLWIDDDLRYDNHYPATQNSRIGCWCDTCLAAFSASEGRVWTRETLDKAMADDKELEHRWKLFSIESLTRVARLIAEETRAVSPKTKMGYQKTFFVADTLVVKTILKELADISGQKVSYRPGGAYYYDKYHPAEQIIKSMNAAGYMRLLGCPDYVELWCPEIESWPRHYGSRTGQSVLLEGFAALAYGMDAVSMYVIDRGAESMEVKKWSMFKPLSEGSDVLREYAKANKGTVAVGFRTNGTYRSLFEFGLTGVPVLPGVGNSLGVLEKSDLTAVNIYNRPSSDVQALRERLNERAASPVLCKSPFVGLVMPRVDEDGALRTLGLLNCRIDKQECIRMALASLPEDAETAIWYELRKEPLKLKIEPDDDGVPYVEIPEIAAWNAGFLKF